MLLRDNGIAEVRIGHTTRYLYDVKKVIFDDQGDWCIILKRNGAVYGWGFNGGNAINPSKVDYIPYYRMNLIDTNVSDIALAEKDGYNLNRFFYLKGSNLYSQGRRGEFKREQFIDGVYVCSNDYRNVM